jgi:hypothetical protein
VSRTLRDARSATATASKTGEAEERNRARRWDREVSVGSADRVNRQRIRRELGAPGRQLEEAVVGKSSIDLHRDARRAIGDLA